MRRWSMVFLLMFALGIQATAQEAPLADASLEEMLLALEQDPSVLKIVVLADPGHGVDLLFPSYAKALATLMLSLDERRAVINSSLDVLLSMGLAEDAVAFFRALPAAHQEALLARPRPSPGERSQLKSLDGGPFLSLSLGAAFFLTGDRNAAHAILRRVESGVDDIEFSLLDAALHPERDPFETLARSTFTDGLWGQVALQLAASYPGFRKRLLEGLAREPYPRFPEDPQKVRRAIKAVAPLAQKQEAQRQQWQVQLDATNKPPSDSERRDHVTEGIERLLETPLLEPCVLSDSSPVSEWTPIQPATPAHFPVVRAAMLDQQAVAILFGSFGGYWVMTSTDAGKSWSAPADTGLHANRPYFVGREGELRLENGRVVLSVQRWERELARVVRLSCDLDVIERDSDGDGLSDVQEHRLLTDPFHEDTDRDGLTDDVDPIPHVPSTGKFSIEALGMIHSLTSRMPDDGSLSSGVAPVGPRTLEERPWVVYVEGERAGYRGLSFASRLVVLSTKEAALARARMGYRFDIKRHFVAANHNRTMIFVDEEGATNGSRYLLREEPEGWRYILLSRWMR